ncbi:hypothetical protein Hanom_Chr16g01505301 [Helianthus anomalus]
MKSREYYKPFQVENHSLVEQHNRYIRGYPFSQMDLQMASKMLFSLTFINRRNQEVIY